MDKKAKQKIFAKREIVKYSAQRAYIGKLTGAGLAGAYGQFKHTQDWDKPITSANVVVGHIDGGVICRALWYEMSYNPARFGKVSPFTYKGREDIYHFCRVGVPENFPGYEIIEKIQSYIKIEELTKEQERRSKQYGFFLSVVTFLIAVITIIVGILGIKSDPRIDLLNSQIEDLTKQVSGRIAKRTS